MKVVLSRRANLDLLAHAQWLAAVSPDAAARIKGQIRSGLKLLERLPAAGRTINENERKWPIRVGKTVYIAIYRIEPDRVVIGRIHDSRQDWR